MRDEEGCLMSNIPANMMVIGALLKSPTTGTADKNLLQKVFNLPQRFFVTPYNHHYKKQCAKLPHTAFSFSFFIRAQGLPLHSEDG